MVPRIDIRPIGDLADPVGIGLRRSNCWIKVNSPVRVRVSEVAAGPVGDLMANIQAAAFRQQTWNILSIVIGRFRWKLYSLAQLAAVSMKKMAAE